MEMITFKKGKLEKKIAKRNISVFNVCLKTNSGIVVNYDYPDYIAYNKWVIGKNKAKRIGKPSLNENGSYEINSGLFTLKKGKLVLERINGGNYKTYQLKKPMANKELEIFLVWPNTKLVIVDCVIPKGAEYYENSDGYIVSNLLKVLGITEV